MANTTAPIVLTTRGRIVRDIVAGGLILAFVLFFEQLSKLFWNVVLMAQPFAEWFALYATPVVVPVVVAGAVWALLIHAEGRI